MTKTERVTGALITLDRQPYLSDLGTVTDKPWP